MIKRGSPLPSVPVGTLPTLEVAPTMMVEALRQAIKTVVPVQQERSDLAKAVTSRGFSRLRKEELLLVLKELLTRRSQAASSSSAPSSSPTTSSACSSPNTSSASASSPTTSGGSSSPTTASPPTSVDTVMGLFRHSKIAHLGGFFEKMDLKTVSTERGEGFNHFVKWVLRHFSSHNLETPQPLREVCIRWSVGIPLFETFYERNTTLARVSREFQGEPIIGTI